MSEIHDVIAGRSRFHVHLGDSLAMLASLPDGCLDALVTDPPYSSGGMFRGDRQKGTVEKYVNYEQRSEYADFAGDTRDQRSFLLWCTLWLAEAWRASKDGALIVLFTDWRQLPSTTDALQTGGWVWRGVVPWVKPPGTYRPSPGFANRCEYLVWGSRGALDVAPSATGAFEMAAPRLNAGEGKLHPTQKPVTLMTEALRPVRPDGLVCDPFIGSGTTGIAAVASGRRFIGAEVTPHYHAVAAQRIAEAADPTAAASGLFARSA